MLSQDFNIIIDRGISALGHGREFLDGFNDTDKSFIFHLMVTVQVPGNITFDTYTVMHRSTHNSDVILVQ